MAFADNAKNKNIYTMITQKKCTIFKTMLERPFQKEKNGSQILDNHELTDIIQGALEKCKREKIKKSQSICFLVNVWFDQECRRQGEDEYKII